MLAPALGLSELFPLLMAGDKKSTPNNPPVEERDFLPGLQGTERCKTHLSPPFSNQQRQKNLKVMVWAKGQGALSHS